MLNRWQQLAPHVLGPTRILIATLLWCHGAQKALSGAWGGAYEAAAPPAILWIAGGIEIALGAAVAAGLFTRPGAVVLSAAAAGAYVLAFVFGAGGEWEVLGALDVLRTPGR